MITLFGQIDKNDYEFVKERYGEPRFAIPAPFIKKNGKYERIHPERSRFILEGGRTIDVNSTSPRYYATPEGQWRPLYEVASYYGNKRGMTLKEGWESKMDFGYLVWYIKRLEAMKSQYGVAVSYPQTYAGIELNPVQIPILLNVGGPYYPVAGANSPCDGKVARINVDESLSTIRGAAGTYASATLTEEDVKLIASSTNNQFSSCHRAIYLFNTSDGAGTTPTGATLSLWGRGKGNGLGSPDLDICASSPTATNNVATGDYQTMGTTSFGSMAYADFITTGYNDIVLNASGIAAINKTGITNLGAKINWDIDNSFGGSWGSGLTAYFNIYFADYNSGSNAPKLVITYTVPITYKPRHGFIHFNNPAIV